MLLNQTVSWSAMNIYSIIAKYCLRVKKILPEPQCPSITVSTSCEPILSSKST